VTGRIFFFSIPICFSLKEKKRKLVLKN